MYPILFVVRVSCITSIVLEELGILSLKSRHIKTSFCLVFSHITVMLTKRNASITESSTFIANVNFQ